MIGASRCTAVILIGVACLVLGGSWQTLAGFHFSRRFGGNGLESYRLKSKTFTHIFLDKKGEYENLIQETVPGGIENYLE